jgi:hypothetical protein
VSKINKFSRLLGDCLFFQEKWWPFVTMINKVDMVLKIDPPLYTLLHTWFSMTRLIDDFLECVCTLMHCAIGNIYHSLVMNWTYYNSLGENLKLLVSSQGRASMLGLPSCFNWKAPWHPNFINLLGIMMFFLQKKKPDGQKIFLSFMSSHNVSNHTRNFVYLNFW